MMRSGIHVFLTAPPCDVWQLSRTLSPGGGQRAKCGHTFLNETFGVCVCGGASTGMGRRVRWSLHWME